MLRLRALRSGSRLLLAAVLLALSPSLARSDDDPHPKLLWKESLFAPRAQRALDVSSPRVRLAAQTATSYLNFKLGSPSSLRTPWNVKKASLKIIPGVGRKYFLQFKTKDLLTGQNLGTCTASVTYLKQKPKPLVDISCSHVKDPSQQLQKDLRLYMQIRGDRKPSLTQLQLLAILGSSYIAWEKATENISYTIADLNNAKQWKRDDDLIEFDCTVVLVTIAFEPSISCHMRIIWMPGQPLQVKYDCSSEDESSGSADGSGVELGSTSEYFFEPESNF